MFRAIIADDFPPFGRLVLELPRITDKPDPVGEVHLFTGVNGTGKTRLLCLLAAALGNANPLAARMKGTESPMFVALSDQAHSALPPLELMTEPNARILFEQSWSLIRIEGVAKFVALRTPLTKWLDNVPAFGYRANPYVTDSSIQTVTAVQSRNRQSCLSFDRGAKASESLLQAIANLVIQAALETSDSKHTERRGMAGKLVRTLESTITEITGVNFRFALDAHPSVSLGVFWGGVKLSFHVLPDGLRSIIGSMVHALVMMDLWLDGKQDPMEAEAVFLLDEVENHLHPAWQRKILPAFQHLFPKSQIFVATHSPFVIASINHGWIHPLTMTPDGKVRVEKLVAASKGESYISVVEDIMGLKEWYDVETEKMLAEFRLKRDKAYRGDSDAQKEARQLGTKIGERSMELDFMMGKELIQMDRQLAKNAGQK